MGDGNLFTYVGIYEEVSQMLYFTYVYEGAIFASFAIFTFVLARSRSGWRS